MAFAKAYKEEITLAYYCFNLALTVAFFIFGTIYLRHRDRRDQQRKQWGKFAETVRSEYSKLKAQDILAKISEVKERFQNTRMDTTITGLDVLRYMIDANYNCSFNTSELKALINDLDSIFQLLNICNSLVLLGTVPNNIRAELGNLITHLGKITLPFFKGEERRTILKCLKHFGSDRRLTAKTEKRVRDVDMRLEHALPYVHCLHFTRSPFMCPFLRAVSYEKCKLELNYETRSTIGIGQVRKLEFLKTLHKDLQGDTLPLRLAREFQEHPPKLKYIEEIDNSDNDEMVLVKVLHEIRTYIHLILKERKELNAELNHNIEKLREVYSHAIRRNMTL